MSWTERPEKKSVNPAKKFLKWSSDDKCFKYWDKDREKDVLVQLPLDIVILEHYHTVKGWDDDSESGIFSNEVYSIGTEPVDVKSFKGGKIANGLYKDIKETIQRSGGHYARSIYAVTNDLEIINLSLKGSAVASYSKFINDNGDQFDKYWIKISKAEEMKKGKINYSVPVFEKGKSITKREKLIPFAQELIDYMVEYNKTEPSRMASEVDKYDDEDVPF